MVSSSKPFFSSESSTNLICVSIHWGEEFLSIPSLSERDIAHAMVEAGADVESVNVGGMHHSAGKILLGKAIFLDNADKESLRRLRDNNRYGRSNSCSPRNHQ